MDGVIGVVFWLVVLLTASIVISLGWGAIRELVSDRDRCESEAWLQSLDEERDREVRLWEYVALYERWEEGRRVYDPSASSLSVYSMAGWTTAAISSTGPLLGASGRPWNDVPTPRTIRIVPEEVPGAD